MSRHKESIARWPRGITALAPLTVLLMAACTTSKAPREGAAGEALADGLRPDVVVIGTTGPLKSLDDAERSRLYASYTKQAARSHPGRPPGLDAAAFRARLGGWASLQTWSIPGVLSTKVRVLVPQERLKDTRFASTTGSLVFGTTGDLVAARSDGDGMVWLERILCADDGDYRTCSKAYRHGVFDANTGQELDKHHRPKANGTVIDIGTYVALPVDEPRHKAKELTQNDGHVTSFESPRSIVEKTAAPAPGAGSP